MVNECTEGQKGVVENIISILAFEEGISFLAYKEENDSKMSEVNKESSGDSNRQQLEPATLVYHESAREIVFRDHVRRSYGDDSSIDHSVSNVSVPASPTTDARKQFAKSAPASHLCHDDLSSKSNDSSSKKSRGSKILRRRKNRKDYLASVDSSCHSVSSIEMSTHSIHNDGVLTPDERKEPRPQVVIANFTPEIEPLPLLELNSYNEFTELLNSKPYLWNEDEGPNEAKVNHAIWNQMNAKEQHVVNLLLHGNCVVKTVKKADWTSFLSKFVVKDSEPRRYLHPADLRSASKEERKNNFTHAPNAEFNSFMTSTSLLPSLGIKMRCYGSTKEYCHGVCFALPLDSSNEDEAVLTSSTWAWPSGYAAKTEFNISPHGDLINGRNEALVSLSSLREMNNTYIYEESYEILGRMVEGGLNKVPYNEIYLRVGGGSVNSNEAEDTLYRSFEDGVGLPIALFTRTIAYGDLIALMRVKKRLHNILGQNHISDIPLLYISPDDGVRVLTKGLQAKLLHVMTNSLNPFQNPSLQHKTTFDNSSQVHLQQKVEELFDLDNDNIRGILTAEECARLAGGFGATDDSVAHLLMDAMIEDFEKETERNPNYHSLQNLVNEGLTAAVRSGDFNTSRQLLILYTLVASRGQQERDRANSIAHSIHDSTVLEEAQDINKTSESASLSPITDQKRRLSRGFSTRSSSVMSEKTLPTSVSSKNYTLSASFHPPPPPPPLDTDRLRSATNSDGLLSVLGAAEILKSMQNEAAKKRTLEAVEAIEEWIHKSENSVAYRLAHWRDLTAAQGDLKIATESSSHFMAFIGSKALDNRKRFAQQLRKAVVETNFESIAFLKAIHEMVSTMHSPCLRLELLQFILGLDNRYSVAHVGRSVELAATCLNISAQEALSSESENNSS